MSELNVIQGLERGMYIMGVTHNMHLNGKCQLLIVIEYIIYKKFVINICINVYFLSKNIFDLIKY